MAEDDQEIVEDPAAARAVVERAVEAYAALQSFRRGQTTEWRVEAEGPQAELLNRERTESSTFAFLRPKRFIVERESYRAVCNGTTCWLQNVDLDQYIEADLDEMNMPVSRWLETHSSRRLSLPLAGEVVIDGVTDIESLFEDLSRFIGVRESDRNGRAGRWVIGELLDPWYQSGEKVRVELWFDEQTGLMEESRGDYADAYRFATLTSASTWGMDDQDIPVVKSATWISTSHDVETDPELSPDLFAFDPDAAGQRVRRFEPRSFGRADQLGLIGQDAPAFAARTLDGEQFSLADQRGRIVFLDFWATWCGPCVAAIPHVQKLAERFQDAAVTVVGISQDSRESSLAVQRFLERHDITFDQIHDPRAEIGGKYMVRGIPCMVLIDQKGKVQDIRTGFSEQQHHELIRQIETLLEGESIIDEESLAARREEAARGDMETDRLSFLRMESPELLGLIGQPAPALRAEDTQGRMFDLQKRDRIVLLYFWMGSLEDEDRPEMRQQSVHDVVEKVMKRIDGKPVDAIGICYDPWHLQEEVEASLNEEATTLPQIHDATGEITHGFSVQSYPCFVFIDSDGIVQDVFSGFSSDLRLDLQERIERLLAGERLVDERELALRKEAAAERPGHTFDASGTLSVEQVVDDRLEPLEPLPTTGQGYRPTYFDVNRDGVEETIVAGGMGHLAILSSDGSTLERLRLRVPGQVQDLAPVWFGEELHWFASTTDWGGTNQDPESTIGLFGRDGELKWSFEPPAAADQLDRNDRVSTQHALAAGDLNGDGESELILGATYIVWSRGDQEDDFGVGIHQAAHIFVLDRAGEVLSQTEVGGTISLLQVIPPADPDGVAMIACWTDTALKRYRLTDRD